MTVKQFNGAAIFVPVTNLQRSAHWYAEHLGFVIRDWDEPDAANLIMENGSLIFTLVKCLEIEPRHFPKNNYEVDVYFNFLTADVEGLHKKLTDNEVNVTKMNQIGHHRFFAFFDPDGNKYGAVNSN